MNIRLAAPADAAALAHIQVDSFRSAYAPFFPSEYLAAFSYAEQEQDWRDLIGAKNAGEILLVAESADGDILGYALSRQADAAQTGYDCELVAMHVRPGMYRRGTGRALMAETARRMHAAGCRSLGLWVLEGNSARRMYEHLGGQQRGEQFFEMEEYNARQREVGYVWDDITRLFTEPTVT